MIIYGGWHNLASGRGAVVDMFDTPVGPQSGGFIHANLVETMLAPNLFFPPPEWVSLAVEIVLGAGLALAFAFEISLLRKFGILGLTVAGLLVIDWFTLHLLSIFFDALPLIASMGLHAFCDQVYEWREDAKRWHHAAAYKELALARAATVERS